MTITPTRLRELIRFADDLGADIDQEYRAMQNFREIAAALRESTTMIAELDGYAASDRIKSENLRLADTELAALRDVREVLRRECEALKDERDALLQKQWASVREISSLKAENGRLREALGWYAVKVNDCRKLGKDGDMARGSLDKDGGSVARAALNATTGEGHE